MAGVDTPAMLFWSSKGKKSIFLRLRNWFLLTNDRKGITLYMCVYGHVFCWVRRCLMPKSAMRFWKDLEPEKTVMQPDIMHSPRTFFISCKGEASMRESGILMHITSLPNAYGVGTMGKCAYDFIDRKSVV